MTGPYNPLRITLRTLESGHYKVCAGLGPKIPQKQKWVGQAALLILEEVHQYSLQTHNRTPDRSHILLRENYTYMGSAQKLGVRENLPLNHMPDRFCM